LSLLAEGNASPVIGIKGYGEIDFERRASSNPVATNSFTPRMRQGQHRDRPQRSRWHLLAGQTWSLTSPSRAGIDPRGIDGPR
jgi:hypothetical protein